MNNIVSTSISFKTKVALFLTVLFWASAFVGIKAGLQSYSPGGLALFRFLSASICMFFIYIRQPIRQPVPLRDMLRIIFSGIVGVGFYHIGLNYGEIAVSSGIASFIISLSPLITIVLAVIFLNEKIHFFGILGMIISLFGVILIALSEENHVAFYLGIIYVFIAAFVGSVYSIMQKPFLKKYTAIDVTAYAIWGATLLLFIFLPNLAQEIKHASFRSTLAGIYLGIFPGTIAYLAWSYILIEMSASRAVTFLYFLPIIATLLGWFLLDEVPALLALIGGVIALLGVWVVNYQKSDKKKNDNFAPEEA